MPRELSLEITKRCPNAPKCDYCSTDATIDGEHLSKERIFEVLDQFEDQIEEIIITGGEPLCHPDFYEILIHSKTKVPVVWVYTCALEYIRYNTHVIREITVEANTVLLAGRENYIANPPTRTHLLKLINQGRAKDLPEQDLVVSRNFYDPNCSETCDHIYLRADGKIVPAPCKKGY